MGLALFEEGNGASMRFCEARVSAAHCMALEIVPTGAWVQCWPLWEGRVWKPREDVMAPGDMKGLRPERPRGCENGLLPLGVGGQR